MLRMLRNVSVFDNMICCIYLRVISKMIVGQSVCQSSHRIHYECACVCVCACAAFRLRAIRVVSVFLCTAAIHSRTIETTPKPRTVTDIHLCGRRLSNSGSWCVIMRSLCACKVLFGGLARTKWRNIIRHWNSNTQKKTTLVITLSRRQHTQTRYRTTQPMRSPAIYSNIHNNICSTHLTIPNTEKHARTHALTHQKKPTTHVEDNTNSSSGMSAKNTRAHNTNKLRCHAQNRITRHEQTARCAVGWRCATEARTDRVVVHPRRERAHLARTFALRCVSDGLFRARNDKK